MIINMQFYSIFPPFSLITTWSLPRNFLTETRDISWGIVSHCIFANTPKTTGLSLPRPMRYLKSTELLTESFYVLVWAGVSANSRTWLIFVPQWTKIDSNTLLELIRTKEIINESSGNYYPNHEYFSKILHQHMPQKKPNRGF